MNINALTIVELKMKRYIPAPIKTIILAFLANGRIVSLWFFSQTRFTAALYCCFFSRQFAREHQSVLKGRLRYFLHGGMQERSNTRLRRNIHRLEKGLITRPARRIFALEYIEETLLAFKEAKCNRVHDPLELKWASDVLASYRSAVALTELEPRVAKLFEAVVASDSRNSDIPYSFSSKKKSDVSATQLLDLCLQRRSVRSFCAKPVDRSLLEKAVQIASLAPSACNRQPYHFFISDEPVFSEKLLNIPLGAKSFAHTVPCVIVITADLSCYSSERDRHLIYIDSALASMQLMLALETLGLSSCPINWPDIEDKERELQSLLALAETVRPIMLIAVGYGDEEGYIPFSHKKSPEQLISYVKL